MKRLMEKWGIDSTRRVVIICIVFTLAGSSITQIRQFAWPLLGFTEETSMWIKVPTYIALIFPTYQVMLMIFGTLFGEFHFFWAKEKKMFGAMWRLITGKKKPKPAPESEAESEAAGPASDTADA